MAPEDPNNSSISSGRRNTFDFDPYGRDEHKPPYFPGRELFVDGDTDVRKKKYPLPDQDRRKSDTPYPGAPTKGRDIPIELPSSKHDDDDTKKKRFSTPVLPYPKEKTDGGDEQVPFGANKVPGSLPYPPAEGGESDLAGRNLNVPQATPFNDDPVQLRGMRCYFEHAHVVWQQSLIPS